MNALVEIQYNKLEEGTYSKPTQLLHFTSDLQSLLKNGFSGSFEGWTDINQILTARPKGAFFFSADQEKCFSMGAYEVLVNVSDLDTSKLFAFPAVFSETAERIVIEGKSIIDADVLHSLSNAPAINYEDYKGTFVAEWIYCGDIPGHLITAKHNY